MGFPKSLLAASPGASPLVSLALAVATSVLVLNSVQPAQAYRTLRQDDQKHALGTPFNSYGCGYFNVSDPQDAGIPHQACYGRDGGIEFCW